MKKIKLIISLTTAISALLISGCSKKYVNDIKSHATNTWNNAGFLVIGYEGYQWSSPGGTWGGKVWYIVKSKDESQTLYHGFISKWGNEYHIYNLTAINAIKGD